MNQWEIKKKIKDVGIQIMILTGWFCQSCYLKFLCHLLFKKNFIVYL
jgi:hypothetical protein